MISLALLTGLLLFYLPLLLAALSCFYHLAVALAALRFRAVHEPPSDYTPPISVLKTSARD